METYQAKCMNEAQKGNSMTELEYYKTREKTLEKELNEANDEINRLNFLVAQESDKANLDKANLEHRLKNQLAEILHLSDINQEQQDEIDRLHEEIQEFSTHVSFLQDASERESDCYIQQISSLQKELSDLSKNYNILQSRYGKQPITLQEEVEKLKTECEKLRKGYKEMRSLQFDTACGYEKQKLKIEELTRLLDEKDDIIFDKTQECRLLRLAAEHAAAKTAEYEAHGLSGESKDKIIKSLQKMFDEMKEIEKEIL
jgi:predicted RNase H-like nuclease (RuvC/YqgF family)